MSKKSPRYYNVDLSLFPLRQFLLRSIVLHSSYSPFTPIVTRIFLLQQQTNPFLKNMYVVGTAGCGTTGCGTNSEAQLAAPQLNR
jgi:hypothetical protein